MALHTQEGLVSLGTLHQLKMETVRYVEDKVACDTKTKRDEASEACGLHLL